MATENTSQELRRLMAVFDDREVLQTADLKAQGGVFYELNGEQWCDTARFSWRRHPGKETWVRVD